MRDLEVGPDGAWMRVTVISGGGHNMMLDNPKAFVEALTR